MNKTNRRLLSVIFSIVSIASAVSMNLKVTTVRDGDSPVPTEENDWVYGIYNESRRDLSIIFESANPAVGINVYKDGKDLVVSRLFAVNPKDTLSFSLAKHGRGTYKVVITMADEDEDYIGNFTIK